MSTRAEDHADLVLPITAPRFVGRAPERELLAEALGRARSFVIVEGGAGVGKSWLLRDAVEGRDGVLVAECVPMDDPFTLGAVVDAMRARVPSVAGLELSPVAGALRPVFPEWANDLPAAPQEPWDPSTQRHHVFRALAEVVRVSGIDVLVLEDAHWADHVTLEWIHFLVTREQHPLRVVVACRPGEPETEPWVRRMRRFVRGETAPILLQLESIDVDTTAELISSMLGGEPVSDDFATFIHQHAAGLPLAIEESVRLMADRADLLLRDGTWVRRRLSRIGVPATVRESVVERVEALSADPLTTLQALAVFAEPVDVELLAEVTELSAEATADSIEVVLASGLVGETREGTRNTIGFRHDLPSRAVYDEIPRARRRELHRRAARSLNRWTPQAHAQIARHYREAGEIADWVRYAVLAAEGASAAGDEMTAGALIFEVIIDGRQTPDEVATLSRRLASVIGIGVARHRALIDRLVQVLDEGGLSAPAEAEVRYLLARIQFSSDQGGGVTQLEAAIPHLAHDPAAHARAMTLLASHGAGRYSRAERQRWLQRASTVDLRGVAPGIRLRLFIDRIDALIDLADPDVWELAEDAPITGSTSDEETEVARLMLNLGDAGVTWGRLADADHHLRRALQLSEQTGLDRVHREAQLTRAHLDWLTGDWTGLADQLRLLAEDDTLAALARLEAMSVLGRLVASTGDETLAKQCLAEAEVEARRYGHRGFRAEPMAAMAQWHLDEGDAERAIRETDDSWALTMADGCWPHVIETLRVRVRAQAIIDPDAARETVRIFAAGLDDLPAPAAQAALVEANSWLAVAFGDPVRGAAGFVAAREAWSDVPRPRDAALAGGHAAEALLAAGRTDEGTTMLRQTLTELRTLGASGDVTRLIERIRPLHPAAASAWRGGRHGYGNELSPRELDVVRLVAAGKTNREIAGVLSRATSTVANQLRSAMRKLDVTSRTGVAAWAIESGLLD